MLAVEELAERVKGYQPNADLQLLRKAYDYAEKAHQGQKRKSGDPYFIHPASVAGVICDLRLDLASVCAGLLHDVVEDTLATRKDIEGEFGTEIADLVDGVTKLSQVNFTSKEDRQASSSVRTAAISPCFTAAWPAFTRKSAPGTFHFGSLALWSQQYSHTDTTMPPPSSRSFMVPRDRFASHVP